MIMNIKQRKIQIEPKTKLNYNMYVNKYYDILLLLSLVYNNV